jgi:Bacterial protein of unknown function (DUF853)/Helicase HerA, central domain
MQPSPIDFEQLGVFYLGRGKELGTPAATGDLLLYDSKDLTTHAVVVGMTGSGKTGLCLNLLEEAGLDRIPAIVIDPKGDIPNLLLTFPDLLAADFAPWVDPAQAGREGKTREEFADSEAAKWRKGLAHWGQDGERIRKFREAVELRVYTPGSSAGRPLTILKSFAAPPADVRSDSDLMRERVSSAASGLLALLDIDADPIRSREHILVSQVLNTAWQEGKDLDLGRLIGQIQSPPFQKVGIMELDAFFPAKDRTALAMTLNNLLASPSFSSWMEGEPLNVRDLLHTADGKPCISILSIAHLNDAERMFFVTILLNEVLTWMRGQAGTSSLRAILYMDEVFGYFPPTKNPPSKQPMLTLLKQARAYGLGVVLATQNPVDLDYKGLSNTGTWFLGRLQTERDKMRVIEGLEGAAAQTGSTFDRQQIEQILAGLSSRVFLMNNVHENAPAIFESRWAMSYLRGPMTRQQIQQLVPESDRKGTVANTTKLEPAEKPAEAPDTVSAAAAGAAANAGGETQKADPGAPALADSMDRPQIPNSVEQRFADLDRRLLPGERLVYRPALFGRAKVHFVKAANSVDQWSERIVLQPVAGELLARDIWENSRALENPPGWMREPESEAAFSSVPESLLVAKNFAAWQKELKDWMYRTQSLTLFRSPELKQTSNVDETEGDFRIRLETAVSELRDLESERLRDKYAARFQTLRDQITRAEAKLDKEKAQYKSRRLESTLSIGGSILGALLGRKVVSSSAVRSAGQASREKQDMETAESSMDQLQNRFRDLEDEFNRERESLQNKLDVRSLVFEPLQIPPRKSDTTVLEFFLAWLPVAVSAEGHEEPLWSA